MSELWFASTGREFSFLFQKHRNQSPEGSHSAPAPFTPCKGDTPMPLTANQSCLFLSFGIKQCVLSRVLLLLLDVMFVSQRKWLFQEGKLAESLGDAEEALVETREPWDGEESQRSNQAPLQNCTNSNFWIKFLDTYPCACEQSLFYPETGV